MYIFVSVRHLYFIIFLIKVSNRYMSQLKDMDPKHPFLVSVAQKEADFDRMCKQYAI